MTKQLTGGCLCGAVRYEWENEPEEVTYCHCNDCKKATGGAYSISIEAYKETFNIVSGQLKKYKTKADSGDSTTRNFCSECGSPIFIEIGNYPDLVWINAGGMDEPDLIQPTLQIWTKSKVSWAHIPDDLPALAEEDDDE